jgi:GntR family transcriptional repressor for pyruvate dehydrogenase complex
MNGSIKPVRLADTIAAHIQTMILEGVLRPGEKLSAERDLAEKLGVSRPSLREALTQLEHKGLLITTKSGTHVAKFLAPLLDPLAELLRDDVRVTTDYFEYRRLMESHAASLAARRATDFDRDSIRACLAKIKLAHEAEDPAEESVADTELHLLIYEAAHNVVILHVMRVFSDLLRKGIFYSREQLYRRPGVRDMLIKQHIELGEAVLAGDSQRAEQAASDHMTFTVETLDEIRRDELRLAASLRRIDRQDLVAE